MVGEIGDDDGPDCFVLKHVSETHLDCSCCALLHRLATTISVVTGGITASASSSTTT